MGYSLSWVAVRGKSPEAVRAELGLQGSGVRESVPKSPITGAELPGGWYLIIANGEPALLEDDALARLSSAGEVVACFVEEHVMCSAAVVWKEGRRLWLVSHDAQRSIEHLHTQGQPPPMFDTIRDRARSRQAAEGGEKSRVDYIFDIPVEVGEALTGYRHDRTIPVVDEKGFEVLVRAAGPTGKTWWKRLFGR